MTTVADYLNKLLYQYDCVVVPELGAFLTHYHPATFAERQGQYLPPRKRVAFNEALRLDDGILTNYMVLHEAINREEALSRISQFVVDLKTELNRTGSFSVIGIGMLTLNEEQRLQFDPALRHNFMGDSFGMPALEVQPVTTFLPALVQESATNAAIPLLIGMPNNSVIVPTEVEEVLTLSDGQAERPLPVRRMAVRWAAAALLIGSLGGLSYYAGQEGVQSLQSSLNPANLLRMPDFLTRIQPVEKPAIVVSKRMVVAVVPVPVVRSAPAPMITPTLTPAAVARPVAVSPVAKVGVSPVAAPINSAVEAAVVRLETRKSAALRATRLKRVAMRKARQAMPHFVIIAGSFSNRANARKLQRQLQQAGYADAYIMSPDASGRLHKVAAFGTSDRAELAVVLPKIHELTGTEAWVLAPRR
jgi:cell division septation protein DedD